MSFLILFNVEKYRDVEISVKSQSINLVISVKSQSRSLKVVPVDRLGMVSY